MRACGREAHLYSVRLVLEPFHIDLRIAFKLFWVLVSNLVSLGALVLVDRNRILQHGYNKIFDSFLVILGKLPILFWENNKTILTRKLFVQQ